MPRLGAGGKRKLIQPTENRERFSPWRAGENGLSFTMGAGEVGETQTTTKPQPAKDRTKVRVIRGRGKAGFVEEGIT